MMTETASEKVPSNEGGYADARQTTRMNGKPTAGQCVMRFGMELAADKAWIVLLLALAGIAAAFATGSALMQGSYVTQRQYIAAKDIVCQLQEDGMRTTIGSFEDGLSPDGCSVVGWAGRDNVKLTLAKTGDIVAVSYRLNIEDMDDVDAAAIRSGLQCLAGSVGKAGVDIGFEAGELPFSTRKMRRGAAQAVHQLEASQSRRNRA